MTCQHWLAVTDRVNGPDYLSLIQPHDACTRAVLLSHGLSKLRTPLSTQRDGGQPHTFQKFFRFGNISRPSWLFVQIFGDADGVIVVKCNQAENAWLELIGYCNPVRHVFCADQCRHNCGFDLPQKVRAFHDDLGGAVCLSASFDILDDPSPTNQEIVQFTQRCERSGAPRTFLEGAAEFSNFQGAKGDRVLMLKLPKLLDDQADTHRANEARDYGLHVGGILGLGYPIHHRATHGESDRQSAQHDPISKGQRPIVDLHARPPEARRAPAGQGARAKYQPIGRSAAAGRIQHVENRP